MSFDEDVLCEVWREAMVVSLMQLNLAERIQLVEDLWDAIAAAPQAAPVTDAQKAELDRRLTSYQVRPADDRSWAEIKATLLRPSQT
jgi:putative addiction module component (TIGR02574 family)